MLRGSPASAVPSPSTAVLGWACRWRPIGLGLDCDCDCDCDCPWKIWTSSTKQHVFFSTQLQISGNGSNSLLQYHIAIFPCLSSHHNRKSALRSLVERKPLDLDHSFCIVRWQCCLERRLDAWICCVPFDSLHHHHRRVAICVEFEEGNNGG